LESNWGRNVFEYGVGNWGVQPGLNRPVNPSLAARILTGPFTNWILLNDGQGDSRPAVFTVAATQLMTIASLPALPGASTRFPYGYNVEPVEHL